MEGESRSQSEDTQGFIPGTPSFIPTTPMNDQIDRAHRKRKSSLKYTLP